MPTKATKKGGAHAHAHAHNEVHIHIGDKKRKRRSRKPRAGRAAPAAPQKIGSYPVYVNRMQALDTVTQADRERAMGGNMGAVFANAVPGMGVSAGDERARMWEARARAFGYESAPGGGGGVGAFEDASPLHRGASVFPDNLSDISEEESLHSMSDLSSLPRSVFRRTPKRIVLGSGRTSDASNSTTSVVSGLSGSGVFSGSLGSHASSQKPTATIETANQKKKRESAERMLEIAANLKEEEEGRAPLTPARITTAPRTSAAGLDRLRATVAPPPPPSPNPYFQSVYPGTVNTSRFQDANPMHAWGLAFGTGEEVEHKQIKSEKKWH